MAAARPFSPSFHKGHAAGVQVLPVVADIANTESLKAAAAAAKDRFGAIHIVI